MKKKSKRSKKRDTVEEEIAIKVPQSFVIHHGVAAGSNIRNLISDFKKVMRPYTAQKLVARKKNTLGDFIKMSGPLKVSHMIMFSQTKLNLYFKIARLPHGPTLTFSIKNYSLSKDVLSSQSKNLVDADRFQHSPFLMTNLQHDDEMAGAPLEKHLKLCSKTFLEMFPPIDTNEVKTSEIKRCCLFNYNEDDDTIDFRHYAIQTIPMGITDATSKLISNKIPDLGSYKDVSDFIKSEILSENEAEDNPTDVAVSTTVMKKGKVINRQSKVKLLEIGPRLTLELVKVESGVCSETVLYHKFIVKSDNEKLAIEKRRERKRLLKQKRREEQEENVKKKEDRKEEHRQRCLKGMGIDVTSTKRKNTDEQLLKNDSDAEDDYTYFREEVGEEPEKDLFKKKQDKSHKRFSKKAKV